MSFCSKQARGSPTPERDWTHFESDANNPASGYFHFDQADRSRPPWVRELEQSSLFVQLSGVGGTAAAISHVNNPVIASTIVPW